MRFRPGLSAGRVAASGRRAAAASAAAGAMFAGVGGPAIVGPGAGLGAPAVAAVTRVQPAFGHIALPDLLIVLPRGFTGGQVARLAAVTGVRGLLAVDGAEITANGRPASVIGVNPAQFRSWVPLATASDQRLWSALGRGRLIASAGAAARLRLQAGASYRLRGGAVVRLPFGATGQLGIAGVDLLVNQRVSRSLGLVHQVAVLISAPGANLTGLTARIRGLLGAAARIADLRPQQAPAAPVRLTGKLPVTYLELFKASAARYCPGMSWSVLAAIGQIESGDGRNNGPSSAGALGPMQFLPSTWAVWGTRGFGRPGAPDIMNPYDAVPSAARLLCADGAGAGGASLRQAIFDYNHANWYVNEVLALAAQYAASYR
jgi:hypothetical protein